MTKKKEQWGADRRGDLGESSRKTERRGMLVVGRGKRGMKYFLSAKEKRA